MTERVKRAFKYRFYPTPEQGAELARTFGCVRKVYNMALAARTEAWSARGQRVSYHASSALLTAWKKTDELAFLNEVSSVPLQQTLRHLQTAFNNFFTRRAGYPRPKSKKKSRRAAEYTSSAFRFRDGRLTLAKMRERLDIVWSRPLPEGATPSTVTVSQDAAGRWFVSLLCEDPTVEPLPVVDAAVGIDAGLDHLLTLSTGEKIPNPRHERQDRQALARAQRHLSRKAKGDGANRAKARRKVARIHARIADRRRDHLHQITTRLVRENQTLVIEDLSVRNMVKNGKLARAISDAGWSEFRSLLEYKAQWYGREVIVADRWFPSSKLCSACGTLQDRMPLHVRTWTCGCGTTHDRDVNAAKNLLAAGRAVTVCGAGVRPQRSLPCGQSVTKQKAPRRKPWKAPRS
ncbi:RNA-guided endonuclease InsQ/TnpB family protein [Streptomyces sp. CA-132043]|uniref:RNA-guided endonuclease InsQ/TnpB family protein n=1 Tax=Streptomyces sp. CA-132043 TaxID=3240048 RepID=UPI003D930CCC